jgi:AraC family transcriptional regulator
VICGGDPEAQVMEFMCAVEVSAFDAEATHLGRMRVPPQHYAVFKVPGDASAVQQTWLALWNEWLPRSGRVPVDGPEFEVYGERFDQRTGRGIEIWSPVQPAGA